MANPFKVRAADATHVVLEIFGGDNNLDPFVDEDLGEIRRGLQGSFAVLALSDYAQKGAVVRELTTGHRRTIEKWGEIDTGDPETIARFITRGLESYPNAAHVAIGLWDHGSGVFGEEDPQETILRGTRAPIVRSDRTHSKPARRLFHPFAKLDVSGHSRAVLNDDTNGGLLTTRECGGVLRHALAQAKRNEPLDLLFSDACLQGMVEVVEELGDHVRVIVGSEELEPGDGWDYYQWFRRMSASPPGTPEAWAAQATAGFKVGYAERPDQWPCTLAAFRTKGRTTQAFKGLVQALDGAGAAGFTALLQARAGSQSFAPGHGLDTFDIVDLGGRLRRLNPAAEAACDALVGAIEADRIDHVALGDAVRHATGLAVWCPGDRGGFERVIKTYEQLAFSRTTGWGDYLRKQFGGP